MCPMGWFVFGFLIYCLIVLSEQVMIALSPHDAEQLRNDPARSAQRAAGLPRRIRPIMASLLLARLLVQIGLVTASVYQIFQTASIGETLYQGAHHVGLPPGLVWAAPAAGLALAWALLFWRIGRIKIPLKTPGRASFWLQRLFWFIAFWETAFRLFVKREKKTQPAAEERTTPETPASVSPAVAGEKRELELLKSIVKFGDVTVKQVMQPRPKVIAVDFRTDFHELLQTVREAEFSRLPVYDEDFDNVTGILYVKDLILHLDKDESFEWQSLIRTDVMLVPESKRATELLQEFKQQKMHMAVVVDEYGGSAGIVTMDDILEEVTGEIRDEFDAENDVRYRKIDDFNYVFDGQTLLNDVCRITGLSTGAFDEVRGTAETLAGLVLELKGDIPKVGAEVSWKSYQFTVVTADNRRIEQLKLGLPRS
jgi:putative hemolysin